MSVDCGVSAGAAAGDAHFAPGDDARAHPRKAPLRRRTENSDRMTERENE
jgi:hypothetical protein